MSPEKKQISMVHDDASVRGAFSLLLATSGFGVQAFASAADNSVCRSPWQRMGWCVLMAEGGVRL